MCVKTCGRERVKDCEKQNLEKCVKKIEEKRRAKRIVSKIVSRRVLSESVSGEHHVTVTKGFCIGIGRGRIVPPWPRMLLNLEEWSKSGERGGGRVTGHLLSPGDRDIMVDGRSGYSDPKGREKREGNGKKERKNKGERDIDM